MKSRAVGLITADLNAAANLIRLRMRYNNGHEFVVWVHDDQILMAPVTTVEAMVVMQDKPDQVVNTYVLARKDKRTGERTFLEAKWIADDLAQHLADNPIKETA